MLFKSAGVQILIELAQTGRHVLPVDETSSKIQTIAPAPTQNTLISLIV